MGNHRRKMKFLFGIALVLATVNCQSVNSYARRAKEAAEKVEDNYKCKEKTGGKQCDFESAYVRKLDDIQTKCKKIEKEFDYDKCPALIQTMKTDLQKAQSELEIALTKERQIRVTLIQPTMLSTENTKNM